MTSARSNGGSNTGLAAGRRTSGLLEHGTRFHEKTARAEVASQSLLSLGRILLLVAVLAILAVIASLRMW